jgi:hypothetical protein
MPYPNDNKLNIVISQTSGSADNTGKFPFTERIISGSNLFILTDANGNLTGSTSIPGGSFTNLTVTSLTASFISSSGGITSSAEYITGPLTVLGTSTLSTLNATNITASTGLSASNIWFSNSMNYSETMTTGSLTAPDLNFISTATTGSDVMFNISATALTGSAVAVLINAVGSQTSYAISASSGIIAGTDFIARNITSSNLIVTDNVTFGTATSDVIQITGSTSISGSLTITGNIAGTIDSASAVLITDTPTTAGTYYVTFVDGTTGVRALRTDSSTLTWNPSTNTLSSSGNLYVGGGTIDGPNGTVNLFASATGINVGNSLNTPLTTFFGDVKLATGLIKGSDGSSGLQVQSYGIQVYGNAISSSSGTHNIRLGTNGDITASRDLSVAGNTQATSWNNGALTVAGGVGIGKNLYVSGSTFLYGDLTIYGTGSIVNISSSTVIIGDNRIVLNAGTPIQRYAGIDVFDSGSGTYVNNVTSSLLWDALSDNWLLVSNNQTTGNPLTQSSAIMIGGPSGSFGNEASLTVNYIPKVQSTGKNLQDSALVDNGTTLSYVGTGISSSQITASQLTVAYTGSITYATGVYITYATGSFTTITITTGSSPGVGTQVPSSPTATGLAGQINVDNNFIYVYTNQVWKRVPLSTWIA